MFFGCPFSFAKQSLDPNIENIFFTLGMVSIAGLVPFRVVEGGRAAIFWNSIWQWPLGSRLFLGVLTIVPSSRDRPNHNRLQ